MHKSATISNGERSGCLTSLRAWGRWEGRKAGAGEVPSFTSQTHKQQLTAANNYASAGTTAKRKSCLTIYNSSRMTKTGMMYKLMEQTKPNTIQYEGFFSVLHHSFRFCAHQ